METTPPRGAPLKGEHILPKQEPRKRHPVPITELPTRDRILVQLLLQLAARDIKNFHPSEQVGWLVYLLEQLESHYDEDEFHRFPPILTALQQDIVLRLQTGSY